MRRVMGLGSGLMVWGVVACGSPESAWMVSEDGAPVVESVVPEWPKVRAVAAEAVVTIGSSNRDGTYLLADPSSARFLDGGAIGVGDSQADRIQVFDSTGQYLTTLGRPGEGPGEFKDLGRIYAYPGDSVAGFDFGLSRTLVFDIRDGGARAISGLHFDARTPVLGVLGSGSLLSYQNMSPTAGAMSDGWDSLRIVLVPADGQGPRDIAHLATVQRSAPGRPQIVLAPRGVMAAASDGFYWARSDRYEIHHFDSLGALRQVIRRRVDPLTISASDERAYREASVQGARENGGDQAAQLMQQRLQDATFAATRPLFGSSFVDRSGRLWMSELPWPSRYVAPRRWSVFNAEGRWLGDVEVPEGFRLEDADGDRVLGVWRDELGVAVVRVHRLIEEP